MTTIARYPTAVEAVKKLRPNLVDVNNSLPDTPGPGFTWDDEAPFYLTNKEFVIISADYNHYLVYDTVYLDWTLVQKLDIKDVYDVRDALINKHNVSPDDIKEFDAGIIDP